jgi:aminoglycoside phosphotransferase (APT) family kinase protein
MPEQNLEVLLATRPEDFARRLLAIHGVPAAPLVAAAGWSNAVWLTNTHVVRLSSGRFRDSFAHEASTLRLLPAAVPHARIRAYGRIGNREWMIQDRIPGQPLLAIWPALSATERRATITQLGTILRALHATQFPANFTNPALADALAPGGQPRNAYHAPPARHRVLLDAVSRVPGTDQGMLREVGTFIAERLEAFTAAPTALVHADIHFSNLLWNAGSITALLDFEGARPASPDQELDTLLRFAREPWLYRGPGSQGGPPNEEVRPLPDWLAAAYPELFSHPRLPARLAVYEVLWQLVQILNFPTASGGADPLGHLKSLLAAGDRWIAF